MQDLPLSNVDLVKTLHQIAEDVSAMRKALIKETHTQSDAEREEEYKRILRDVFGDED